MKIVVTGASRGIGYQLVKQLSSNPDNTIFAVSRNGEQLEQLKNECVNKNVITITCDLSKELSILSLLTNIKKHTPTINALVNNAGAIINKPFSEITKFEYFSGATATRHFNIATVIFMCTISGSLECKNAPGILYILTDLSSAASMIDVSNTDSVLTVGEEASCLL